MISDKPSVGDLLQLLKDHGVKEVVISPGSRNAPLSLSFENHADFKTYSIIDERSAAFFALGLAQELGRPVAICCTSGSAGLNYAPALVEALYQRIPVIAITADRPIEWVDQGEGQTMRQSGMLNNVVKKSIDMAEPAIDPDLRWFNSRQVNEAMITALHHPQGPVHINFPFRESLYQTKKAVDQPAKAIHRPKPNKQLSQEEEKRCADLISQSRRVLVVTGLSSPNPELLKALESFAQLPQVNVLTETTSNLPSKRFLGSVDRILIGDEDHIDEQFLPDILITIGSALISKKIKALLRKHRVEEHWHVDRTGQLMDTFQQLDRIIEMRPEDFFNHMSAKALPGQSDYQSFWLDKDRSASEKADEFGRLAPLSDLKVVHHLLHHLPEDSLLHMANSACVRYVQLFDQRTDVSYRANRGVSGIDGCTSTCLGAHQAAKRPTTLLTGDTAFFYDSNGLWNSYVNDGFKVVVVNNGGGGIFRIIDGPAETGALEKHFEAHHNTSAEQLARMHGLKYLQANDSEGLQDGLVRLYNGSEPALLEVFTPRTENPKQLWAFFDYIKQR